ncbi:MAG: PepSY domain-containing protein [Gammaproteobacteria bacterium]|uniref:PepSY domain-containing protein n=1 Tax=Rhodoferax sp. TaxID=50421 RepID=UPI0018362C50|nr:PepSY domain-containing protein [Rhodoferax sp.]MBU3898109.1 PepSY domain-containing protein [Gammaproteobacteria bacterium]MBA3058609.1 PepSY domain-containing protein [Rhodoferax sp.]MBU3999134.1 PepSY domain-containing protein [Gammaproteobacteria bacterium]MBU4081697.1 PepSY domain-containing protein [Gammaproteobacteria bacterium]MBU4113545.1 PepSY domain-containing protein [Gammaproteobacteria bacterium]
MNSSFSLSTLCLAGCLLAGAATLTPAHADDDSQWHDAAAALSVPQVLQKLDAAGYRNIEKIQLKRGSYEVRTTGRDGERVKLHVNAQTGQILGQRESRKADDHAGSKIQKLMGNCNERRCRDDLVPAPGAAPALKP